MEQQAQNSPQPTVPNSVLEYHRPAQARALVTASGVFAAIVAVTLAIGLLAGAGFCFVLTCYLAAEGFVWGVIAGFLGFAFLLSGTTAAIGSAAFIVRGHSRLPEGFRDSSRWREGLAVTYSAIIGMTLLIVPMLLVPSLMALTDTFDILLMLLAMLVMLIVAGGCLCFSWRRGRFGVWIRRALAVMR